MLNLKTSTCYERRKIYTQTFNYSEEPQHKKKFTSLSLSHSVSNWIWLPNTSKTLKFFIGIQEGRERNTDTADQRKQLPSTQDVRKNQFPKHFPSTHVRKKQFRNTFRETSEIRLKEEKSQRSHRRFDSLRWLDMLSHHSPSTLSSCKPRRLTKGLPISR
jgi:hypothetical protein